MNFPAGLSESASNWVHSVHVHSRTGSGKLKSNQGVKDIIEYESIERTYPRNKLSTIKANGKVSTFFWIQNWNIPFTMFSILYQWNFKWKRPLLYSRILIN